MLIFNNCKRQQNFGEVKKERASLVRCEESEIEEVVPNHELSIDLPKDGNVEGISRIYSSAKGVEHLDFSQRHENKGCISAFLLSAMSLQDSCCYGKHHQEGEGVQICSYIRVWDPGDCLGHLKLKFEFVQYLMEISDILNSYFALKVWNTQNIGAAVGYVWTMYGFINETLGKHSYAKSLQATLNYGLEISPMQGLGLGFTYGLTICTCALQPCFEKLFISKGKVNDGQVIAAPYAIILRGLGLSQAVTNFYSFEQGSIVAQSLFEMISRSPARSN